MRALIIVDIQNDFLPGGALAVKGGDRVIPIIQKLLKKEWDVILASKDWHPKDHGSFAVAHQKKVGDVIELDGIEQILWPVHCVQNTNGSEFVKGWDTTKVEKIFYKGIDKNIDSYSTFFDNEHRRSTGLGEYLKERNIQEVYLVGLATDFCVKHSALDSLYLGFDTHVITDGCRGVNLHEGDDQRALQELEKAGAKIITSQDLDF